MKRRKPVLRSVNRYVPRRLLRRRNFRDIRATVLGAVHVGDNPQYAQRAKCVGLWVVCGELIGAVVRIVDMARVVNEAPGDPKVGRRLSTPGSTPDRCDK